MHCTLLDDSTVASLYPQADRTTDEPPTAQYVDTSPLAGTSPDPCTVTIELAAVLTSAGVTMLTLATATSSTKTELPVQSCRLADTSTVLFPAGPAAVRHDIWLKLVHSICTTVTPPYKHHLAAPSSTPAAVTTLTTLPPAMSATDGTTCLSTTVAL
jgi:hypothetical protein